MTNKDKKQEKGVWIPEEVLKLEGLNGLDMIVLSYYLAFTEKGSLKQCNIKAEKVAAELHIPLRNLERSRSKLKKMGLLQTNFFFNGKGTKTTDLEDITNSAANGGIPDNQAFTHSAANGGIKKKDEKGRWSAINGGIHPAVNGGIETAVNGGIQYNEQYLKNTSKEEYYLERITLKGIDTGDVPEIPVWMNEVEPTEPFEIYSEPLEEETSSPVQTGMEIFNSELHKVASSYDGDLKRSTEDSYDWLETLGMKYALMKNKTELDKEYLQYRIENGSVTEEEKKKLSPFLNQ